MASLEINVSRGGVPVDAKVFFETAGGVIDLVQQIERNDGRTDRSTRWVVQDLRVGSAVAVATPIADDEDETQSAEEASGHLVEGIRALAEAPVLPSSFNLNVLRGLLRVAKGREDGSEIRLIAHHAEGAKEPRITAVLAADVVRNAQDLLSVRRLEFDSVQGEIDRLDVRGGKREVSIFDTDQQRSVRATFGEEMLPDVIGSIKCRVAAWGVAQRNASGQILGFQIERLERIEERRPIIPVREIAGIAPWWTDGEDPTEWVRRQRAGE